MTPAIGPGLREPRHPAIPWDPAVTTRAAELERGNRGAAVAEAVSRTMSAVISAAVAAAIGLRR